MIPRRFSASHPNLNRPRLRMSGKPAFSAAVRPPRFAGRSSEVGPPDRSEPILGENEGRPGPLLRLGESQGMAAIDMEILIRRLDFGRYGKLPV
jgi:hypothetical protein